MGINEDRKIMNEIMKKLEKNEKSIRDVEIFNSYQRGYTVAEISKMYEISESTVRRSISKYTK